MRQHLHKLIGISLIFLFYTLPSYGQIYTMDGTPVNDCGGFFMDSGGGAGAYGLNENFTTTLCSDGVGGTHVQLQFTSIDIGSGESFIVYDSDTATPGTELDPTFLLTPGNPFILQATAANPSGCLTIVFTSDATDEGNSGWSAQINCIAACQIILSDLVSSVPEAMPQDTGWIDICPGQRVEFFGTGIYPQDGIVYNHSNLTSSFEWVFGDGNTAVGPNVTNVFTEPGGYIVQLKITDQFGCENTNFISQRVRVSTYPTYLFEGTLDETLCSGDTIMITSSVDTSASTNVSVFPNQGSFQQTLVLSNPLLLPDGTGAVYEETLSFTQFSPGAVLTNPNDILNLTLDLEHSYGGDLDIELICPDGSSIFMLDFPSGVGSTNFGEPFASSGIDGQSNDLTLGLPYTYVFVNDAANGTLEQFDNSAPTYTYTTVPNASGQTHTYTDTYFPAGEYEPFEPFSDLLGCPLNGDWTIRVQDNLGADNGWMTEWSMTFADHLYPNLETFTPNFVDWGWIDNPTIITADQNSIEASPVNAGIAAYTFWVLDDFGCVNDTTLHFDILPPTHPDCYNCDIQINEQEDVILCEGESAVLDASPTTDLEQCITFERFPQDPIGAGNHPSGNPYRSPLMINSINPMVISNPFEEICSICVNFSTNFLSDINIVLEAPNGATLPLAIANGGGSNLGYVNTCFSPDALIDIESGSPPYTGEFQPEGNWSSLIGSPINGEWNLIVTDGFGILDYGELAQWSITFNNVNEYTYTWNPSAGLSCNDCDMPTAMPNNSTSYQVDVEDIYGCTFSDNINVSVIADLPDPIVSCEPIGEDVLFEWENIPGVAEFEYNIVINSVPQGWVGPYANNTLLVSMLDNLDEVTLIVRPYFSSNVNNCPIPEGSSTCIASFCTVMVDAPLINGVSCFGETDGNLTIQVIEGEAPFSYQISGDPMVYTTPVFGDLAAGSYTYTVIDDTNCDVSFDIEIPTPDSLFADATQTFIGCFGENTSTAQVVPGGGSGGNYSYLWSDSQTTDIATNLAPGNYSVIVTDENNCAVSTDVVIVELDAIQFSLSSEDPTCNGFNDGTAEISMVTGGVGLIMTDYTYSWSDNSNGVTRDDLLGGVNYDVTVADAQGCESISSQMIQDPVAITFAIQTAEPSCFSFVDGFAEVVNISGPNGNDYTVQWDAAAANQETMLASGLAAGSYSVVIEDDLGCTATNNTTIAQPEEISLTLDVEDNECFSYSNGSINTQVSGGTPIYSYLWTGGSVDASLESLLAGDYSVTITDSRGCQVTQAATIEEPASLETTAVPSAVSCYGERDGMLEMITEGGTPPFQFSLNNGNFLSSSTLIGLYPGEYVVTIRDVNGCEFFTAATVEEPAELGVDAGIDAEMLYGDSIEIAVVVTNQQGDVDVFWEAPYDGTLSCLECLKPFASPDFTIDYEVYVVDENGCEGTDMIRVFVNKPKLVVVPTGFTPNGDLVNNRLNVLGKPGTTILDFQVFDRWGEKVFQSEGEFLVNTDSDTTGWDGTFRTTPLNAGVFVWYVVALHEDGTEEVFSGQTTLIR